MFRVEEASLDDYEEIYKIWQKETDSLGWILKENVYQFIDDDNALVVMDDNKIIGFALYSVLKTKPIIRIEGLWTHPDYRGQNIAIGLIKTVIERHPYQFAYDYILQVEAYDGLPNNSFYDKISSEPYELVQKKILNRVYTLDIEKIDKIYNSRITTEYR